MHSELLLGDSRFFVVDEFPHMQVSPKSLGGSSVTLHLYVEDVDALFDRAVDAGATALMPVQDRFWGDRYGILQDPFGHRWSVASQLEDLSPKQQQQRAETYAKENAAMPNMSKDVDAYIAKSPEFARPILTKIRALFHKACPDIEEKLKWSVPSFEYKGMLGGMAAFKQYVTVGFWKQSLMKNPHGLFDQDGGVAMGSRRLMTTADLPPDIVLITYIKEAVALNENGVKVSRSPRRKVALAAKVPADLARALKANAKAKTTFAGFSPSQRNEYVEWITEAKQAATRANRLETAIDWIAQGKPRNWKYMRAK